jgi:hypothetical protein
VVSRSICLTKKKKKVLPSNRGLIKINKGFVQGFKFCQKNIKMLFDKKKFSKECFFKNKDLA